MLLIPGDKAEEETGEFARIEAYPESNAGVVTVPLDPAEVRRLLVRRTVGVRWGEPARSGPYPINVLDTAKAGLPSVLGARPDEQQLLAYFHGRIGEDDLLALLEQRAQHLAKGVEAGTNEGPSADLQNYLIREFVESLYGLEETLKTALYSPRALERALLGEFSPAALAERVLTSLRAGRRSGTAAAFQLAELVRVVSGLPITTSDADQKSLADVSQRAVNRLLALVAQAAQVPSFSDTLRETHFAAFVRASLPRDSPLGFWQQQATKNHQRKHPKRRQAMGLRLDPALDLGRDTERMTPEDTRRQEATTNCLLDAFSAPLNERLRSPASGRRGGPGQDVRRSGHCL